MKTGICRTGFLFAFFTFVSVMSASSVLGQHIKAVLEDNEVWSHGWNEGESIEVRIGAPDDWGYTETTWADSDGNWIIDTAPFEIQPGQTVQVEGDTVTREHVVYYLTVENIDTEADIVSGTADPHSEVLVTVHAEDVRRTVTADTTGEWLPIFRLQRVKTIRIGRLISKKEHRVMRIGLIPRGITHISAGMYPIPPRRISEWTRTTTTFGDTSGRLMLN